MYRDRGLPLLHMWVDDGADAEGAAAVLAAARALAKEPEVAVMVSIVQVGCWTSICYASDIDFSRSCCSDLEIQAVHVRGSLRNISTFLC